MATLAAVDLGAQSGRVAVGRFDGERLGVTDVHRFPNVPVRTRDTLNWDILRVYRDVLDGLRAAAREAGRVDSVAVDSWGVDFALIDSQGRLVQNPVHYRDMRRARAMDGVLARIPARELYDRTGIQLMPINTVFELGAMAAEADPALDAAATMLLDPRPPALLVLRRVHLGVHQRDDDAVLRPAHRRLGDGPARAPRRADAAAARRRPAGDPARAAESCGGGGDAAA